MANTNSIGSDGENIASLRLTKHDVFNVSFLGEKFPISDLLLEINDTANPYLALIQVKTTNSDPRYNKGNGNMKTPVPDDKLKAFWNRPIPTYVAGVDLRDEVIFIAPAYANNGLYPSIPLKLRLDNLNPAHDINELNRLKEDILNFYNTHSIPIHKRNYISIII